MIYTPLTNLALRIAYEAHHGQKDKAGQAYIFHPLHLAEQMEDELSCCVALLHDVVEDGGMALSVIEIHFPMAVTEAVGLLSHDKQTDYFDYIRALKHNPIALAVKLADLKHNSDFTRFSGCEGSPEGEKLRRLKNKYRRAMAILLGQES